MATEGDQVAESSTGVSAASLALFRILFGLVMAGGMIRFLLNGWVEELFLRPAFHFPYPGFEWVRPWPGWGMHLHVMVVAFFALAMAAGWHYRLASFLFFIGFTWLELIDQTNYLNHYYLVSLLAGWMTILPAHRLWSVDSRIKPGVRSPAIPRWPLNLLRFQFGIVYGFAGIAKLNPDWILHAQPMRIWLAARSDLPLIGPWLDQTWIAYAASWFGAVYDLTIPFFLLWHRTNPVAFCAVVFFHVLTGLLFPIGMFPWIMTIGATLFFAPSWPMDLAKRLGVRIQPTACSSPKPMTPLPPLGKAMIGAYVAAQILLPMRCLLYEGNTHWTYDGFNAAWKVMIAEKRGHVTFDCVDRLEQRHWRVDPKTLLTPRQSVMMAQDPYLIRQFARHLSEQEGGRIEVRADAFATLNGRPSQRLIDRTVDLSQPEIRDWILPLESD